MSLKNLTQTKTIILLVVSVFLLLVPFLIWGNTYLVGGDDTRLYYIFPREFLKNYAFRIVSDNTLGGAMTGYASVSYFAPVFFVIALFKLIPFISTQMLLYGLNLVLGFWGFYKFIGLWIYSKDTKVFYGRVIAGLFYVSSVYLVDTIYRSQLLSLYLVSIIPFTAYYFIKGVREKDFRFIIISTLIFSLFSSTINTLPWAAASLLTLIPILLFEWYSQKKHFLGYAFLFLALSFALNFYWIFHLVYQYIHPVGLQTMIQYYSSTDFIKDNIRIITGVSQLYSPLNIPFNQMDTNFIKNFSWVNLLQSVFFGIIVFAASFIKSLKREETFSYGVILFSFLLAWYFFSPDIGAWGRDIFLYFSLHIPFFTMFRNMYDKFSLSLSLTYAMLLAISLSILSQKIKNNIYVTICVVIIFAIFFSFFVSEQYLKNNISNSATFSGTFNDDFTNLTSYLRQLNDPSHVVWIPLNGPTYTNIADKYLDRHYYSGLSPMRVLANMSDYTGRFGFITQSDLFLGDKIFALLEKKKYDQIGQILQQRNAKYVIVDHQNLPSNIGSFMYGGDNKPLLKEQGETFQKVILGKKIKDFGKRYSLYYINPKYANEKLYLQDNMNVPKISNNFTFDRIASYQYEIVINNLSKEEKLVFLDPYSKDWELFLQSKNENKSYALGKNILVYNYANGWTVSPKEIKDNYDSKYYTINPDGSINLHMLLYFKPQSYTVFAYIISITTFLLMILAFVIKTLWKKHR